MTLDASNPVPLFVIFTLLSGVFLALLIAIPPLTKAPRARAHQRQEDQDRAENRVMIPLAAAFILTSVAGLWITMVEARPVSEGEMIAQLEEATGVTALAPIGEWELGQCRVGGADQAAEFTWVTEAGHQVRGLVLMAAERDGECTYELTPDVML